MYCSRDIKRAHVVLNIFQLQYQIYSNGFVISQKSEDKKNGLDPGGLNHVERGTYD